jgi:hypothetical protein
MKKNSYSNIIVLTLCGIFEIGLVSIGNGQIFGPPVKYAVEQGPRSVDVDDLDGDGDNDLAVSNAHFSNSISILLNYGDGTFVSAVNYPASSSPWSVKAIDLDGDGDLDLSTANLGGCNVSNLFNNGDGTFVLDPVFYPTGEGPFSIASADFDGDGDQDLVTANRSSDDITILYNVGNGTFENITNLGSGDGPHSVITSDVDGDGDVDIAAANEYSNDFYVFLNNGDGSFAAPVNYFVIGNGPVSMEATDLNDDGTSDLIVATINSKNISVHLNKGDGTFADGVFYRVGIYPHSVSSADLDGDGDKDLTTAHYGSKNVAVLLNNGDGTFILEAYYEMGESATFVKAEDLNGDGAPDLAVSMCSHNPDFADSVAILINQLGPFGINCTTFNDLDQTIQDAEIDNEGVRNSLQAKANNARKQYDRGNLKTSGNVLCALLHETNAQDGKHITPESSQDIRDCVKSLAENLGIPLPCEAKKRVASPLFGTFPNPFRKSTVIEYRVDTFSDSKSSLPIASGNSQHITLYIYDITGRKVSTLVDGVQEVGKYNVDWNGKNFRGEEVPSGIYFYRLHVGEITSTKKLILLR